MHRRIRNSNQMPMEFIVPETGWTLPTELPDLRNRDLLAIDLETRDDGLTHGRGAGWVYKAGYIVGVAVAWEGGSVYVPVRHPETDNFSVDSVVRWLQSHVESPTPRWVTQNGGYDWGWLDADFGVRMPDSEHLHDTQVAAYLVDENRLTYNLSDLCVSQGLPPKDETLLREAAHAYGLDPKKELWRLPARFVGPYGAGDADRTLRLLGSLLPTLRAEGLEDSYRLEMDLLPMTLAMRRRGIRLNLETCESAQVRLRARREAALSELSRNLGRPVTMAEVNRNKFLEMWFTDAGLTFPRAGKKEAGSFESKWMKRVDHWLPQLIVEAKASDAAAEKFIQTFLIDYSHNGRLHAEVHQTRSDEGGTRSFRFSYSDPPLQQMPARDEEIAAVIRGAFEPEPGELWLGADYSQQEYRLIVHFASLLSLPKAEEAVRRYWDDPKTDYHSMVADMTGLDRKPAKDTNFAKAFGAGPPKFATMINKSLAEATAIMEQYDDQLPFVSLLGKQCAQLANRRGYIKLLDGQRSHFDQWEPAYFPGEYLPPCGRAEAARRAADESHPWYGSRLRRAFTHKAMNRLIQGSAARQTKMAMRQCWREGYLPLLQMHDELDFSFGSEQDGNRVAQIMREVVTLEVPVMVDAEWGTNWGNAKYTFEKAKRLLEVPAAA